MRIKVYYASCESNGLCEDAAPELFRHGDDDNLQVLDETPDEALRPKLEEAVRRCPKQALSIEE